MGGYPKDGIGQDLEDPHSASVSAASETRAQWRRGIEMRLTRVLKHGWFPWAGRVAMLAFLLLLTFAVFFGSPDPRLNFATVMCWTAWWPLMAISYLVVGRIWCAVCPMGALSELVHRWLGLNLKAPSLFKHGYIVAAILFFAVLYQAWVEEVARAAVSPLVTGFILWSFTVGAVVGGLIFERWTWCRHLCPLGAWTGVFAMSSLVEVRADPQVCVEAECKGIYCYFGRDQLPGCPFHQVPKTMQTNRYCSACGNCIKACPNSAITVRLRPPGVEFLSQRRDMVGNALIGVVALGVVGFQAFVMTEPWARFREDVSTNPVLANDALLYGGTLLVFVATAVGSFILASRVFTLLTRTSCSAEICRFGFAFLPLALAAHIGHNLVHFLNGYQLIPTAVVGLIGLGPRASAVGPLAGSTVLVGPASLHWIEMAMVLFGMGVALWLVWRLCHSRTTAYPHLILAAPYVALAVAYALAFAVVFTLPMATRL